MAKRRRRHGKRFRLLIYKRMWQRWALPSLLVMLASFAWWWYAPQNPLLQNDAAQPDNLRRSLTLIPAFASFAILVYSLLARRMAWVQCHSNHLRIRTPFYPLVVSYLRIRDVHPLTFGQVFDPAKEKPARRRWLQPYWRKTAVIVELSDYPVGRGWLRLWLSRYLMKPSASAGFVLLVDDWMALSQQLDDFRNVWAMRRLEQRQKATKKRR